MQRRGQEQKAAILPKEFIVMPDVDHIVTKDSQLVDHLLPRLPKHVLPYSSGSYLIKTRGTLLRVERAIHKVFPNREQHTLYYKDTALTSILITDRRPKFDFSKTFIYDMTTWPESFLKVDALEKKDPEHYFKQLHACTEHLEKLTQSTWTFDGSYHQPVPDHSRHNGCYAHAVIAILTHRGLLEQNHEHDPPYWKGQVLKPEALLKIHPDCLKREIAGSSDRLCEMTGFECNSLVMFASVEADIFFKALELMHTIRVQRIEGIPYIVEFNLQDLRRLRGMRQEEIVERYNAATLYPYGDMDMIISQVIPGYSRDKERIATMHSFFEGYNPYILKPLQKIVADYLAVEDKPPTHRPG